MFYIGVHMFYIGFYRLYIGFHKFYIDRQTGHDRTGLDRKRQDSAVQDRGQDRGQDGTG